MKQPLHGTHQLTRVQIDSLRVLALFPRVPVATSMGNDTPGRTIGRHAARALDAAGLIRVWIEFPPGRRSTQWAELTGAGKAAVEEYREWKPESVAA